LVIISPFSGGSMGLDEIPKVVFLPGGILPASLQFAPLLKVLNSNIRPLLKDLEVYLDGKPPDTYSLSNEVEGLHAAANKAGMDTFHLVSYSIGGAVALAYTGAYPEQVESLALIEPTVIPSQEWYLEEADYCQQMGRVSSLPEPQRIEEFMRVVLRQGVPLPPAPAYMQPPSGVSPQVGLKTMIGAFDKYDLPYDRLRAFTCPVYLAVTELSNPVEIRKAVLLKHIFPVSRVEVYPYRHHFDPPHRAEPERFAWSLISLWERAKVS
jgi:pimeloyl-ACP methyl ester carboxylesterase